MDDPSDRPAELTPGLRSFLTETERPEGSPPSKSGAPVEIEFEVEEPMLDGSAAPVRTGGVKLNLVTTYLLTPDDFPAVFRRRPDVGKARLVAVKFWLMFRELGSRRSYTAIRIRIKIEPFAPALMLRPDQATGSPPNTRAGDVRISAELAELLRTDGQEIVTAIDEGEDGFGWIYEASDETPLRPRRHWPVVILQVPPTTMEITGSLKATAQISKSAPGVTKPMKTSPVKSAAPFQAPLEEAPSASQPRSASYDLGLIIPLSEEFDYAKELIPFEQGINDGDHWVYPFSVPGTDRRGLAFVLFGMGPTTTGVAAANLLQRYNFPLLGLVGIAGSLNDRLRLGDVVVASVVKEYLHRAKAVQGATDDDFEFDTGGNDWRVGRNIVRYVNNFRHRNINGEFKSWQARGKARHETGGLTDPATVVRDGPDYMVGTIGSGTITSESKAFLRWFKKRFRECVAVEMEGSGVAEASYQHGAGDMLIVRGISDFSIEGKATLDSASGAGVAHGAWRRYAMMNAVDLFTTILRSPDFPWTPAGHACGIPDTHDSGMVRPDSW